MKRVFFVWFCLAAFSVTVFCAAALAGENTVAPAVSTTSTTSTTPATEKTYINGIDPHYPPFTFLDKTGKPAGFDIDAINWIAENMGFKVVHQPIKWAEVIPTLQSKKIDMVASGMSIDERRKKEVSFSTVYYKTVMVMVSKENSSVMPDKTMKPDVKWGVQVNTPEDHWINDNLIEGKSDTFKLITFDSVPTIMQNLIAGKVDIAAVNRSIANEYINKGMPLRIIGRYGQPDDLTAYAVRKDDPQLLTTLNEGLKHLMATPFWKQLKVKYDLM